MIGRCATDPRRRGGAYIAVLGAAMLIALIGIASMAAVRVRFKSVLLAEDSSCADMLARSGVDVAHFNINANPNWRANYTNNTWIIPVAFGDGAATMKLVDEEDGNLADDITDSVRIYVGASDGGAARYYSAKFRSPPLPNIISNGTFESGTSGWSALVCTITHCTDGGQSGTSYLRTTGRILPIGGPMFAFDKALFQSGKTYKFSVWARARVGTVTIAPTVLMVTTTTSMYLAPVPEKTVGTSWTLIEGTITAAYTGTVTNGPYFMVNGVSGSGDFDIDEASLVCVSDAQLTLIPGSWRREVLP